MIRFSPIQTALPQPSVNRKPILHFAAQQRAPRRVANWFLNGVACVGAMAGFYGFGAGLTASNDEPSKSTALVRAVDGMKDRPIAFQQHQAVLETVLCDVLEGSKGPVSGDEVWVLLCRYVPEMRHDPALKKVVLALSDAAKKVPDPNGFFLFMDKVPDKLSRLQSERQAVSAYTQYAVKTILKENPKLRQTLLLNHGLDEIALTKRVDDEYQAMYDLVERKHGPYVLQKTMQHLLISLIGFALFFYSYSDAQNIRRYQSMDLDELKKEVMRLRPEAGCIEYSKQAGEKPESFRHQVPKPGWYLEGKREIRVLYRREEQLAAQLGNLEHREERRKRYAGLADGQHAEAMSRHGRTQYDALELQSAITATEDSLRAARIKTEKKRADFAELRLRKMWEERFERFEKGDARVIEDVFPVGNLKGYYLMARNVLQGKLFDDRRTHLPWRFLLSPFPYPVTPFSRQG